MIHKIKDKLRGFGLLKIVKAFCTVIYPGMRVYMKIINKYGSDTTIFIGQHPGTGDVYLQSMMLSSYCESKEIYKYVLTVIGVPARKVTELFHVENVEQLTLKESNALIRLYKILHDKVNLRINVLHYHPMELYYDEYIGYLRNYRGLNFFDMMSLFVFEGAAQKALPDKNSYSEERIEQLFRKYRLKKDSTVLLAPYANSLNGFSIDFWEKLASSLNKRGYRVCTNSFGLNEPPIKETCGVSIQYKDLIEFVERAGAIISLRSGLCDIISSAKCKKIILYPEQDLYSIMGGLGTSYEYFSLNRMGLCDDAVEYRVSLKKESNIKKLKRDILSNFPDVQNKLLSKSATQTEGSVNVDSDI